MKSKKWMMKAMILGSAFFIAAYFVKPVGVSTQFSVLSGIIHSTIEPGIITEDENRETGYSSSNEYYDKSDGKLAKSIKHPWNYDFVFVLAIPLGAFLVSFVMKQRNGQKGTVEKQETCEIHQAGFVKQYLPSFLGGFLLLYGARMADGCTSGHMMSGMMQGAVSGYLFAAAVFAVAIPTALIVEHKQKTRGR